MIEDKGVILSVGQELRLRKSTLPHLVAQRRNRRLGSSFAFACASEPFLTLLDPCQWPCLAPFPCCSPLKAPSLHRHYPASPVLQASPPPWRPRLTLATVRASPPTGLPMLLPPSPSMRASVTTPAGPKGCPRRSLPPPSSAFPISQVGRPPHCPFRDVHSRSGPHVR